MDEEEGNEMGSLPQIRDESKGEDSSPDRKQCTGTDTAFDRRGLENISSVRTRRDNGVQFICNTVENFHTTIRKEIISRFEF